MYAIGSARNENSRYDDVMHSSNDNRFWQNKSLTEMNTQEWESLCDGCGQCCLNKLEDEDSHELFVTNVACTLLDIEQCRCTDYSRRARRVASCLMLRPADPALFRYLPTTCAYRCLAEGRELPSWHPLLSDNPNAVHELGISVKAYAVSEDFIHPDQLPEHVIGQL